MCVQQGIPLAAGAFVSGFTCALATGYIRHNSRVVTTAQAKAWDRTERKQREEQLGDKRIRFLATTSRGPRTVYGVIDCKALEDHDLVWLLAADKWQRNRRDVDLALLLIDGQPAALGARALDVLIVLAARPDHLLSKRELLDHVLASLGETP